jgi:hypothetical protein
MPTPIGHSLAGFAAGEAAGVRLAKRRWVSMLGLMLIANLPDADYIPGYLVGRPNAYHHYALHGIGAAVSVGAVIGMFYWLRFRRFLPYFALTSATYSTHLLLDYLAVDTSAPFGLQLFWPLTTKFFVSPFPVFMDIAKGQNNEAFFASLLAWHNLRSILWELVVMVPVIVALRFFKRKTPSV